MIKYQHVRLQGKIHANDQEIKRCENTTNRLREFYVDHAKKPGLDNVVMIVHKHTSKDNDIHFDYPYYIACMRRCAVAQI